MRKRSKSRTQREPTIALINIVFLMLVFFMVAGTLSKPIDSTMSLVNTSALEGRTPPDTLVIFPEGRMNYQGEDQPTAAGFIEGLDETARDTVRVVPDRNLPADMLIKIAGELRSSGAQRVLIVTERGLQ